MVVNIKRLKSAISIFLNFLDELDKFVTNELENATASQIRLRRDNLVSQYTQFLEYQTTLELEEESALETTTRPDVDRHYYKLRPLLEDRLEELKDTSKKSLIKPIEDLGFFPKLPELTFEIFYGEPTKFRSFIESFDTHIHNNPRLNDFTKFQYLKSCCKDPGAKPFENLEFLAVNYAQARELLFERFNKTNRIVEEHVNSLFKVKTIEKPNAQKLLELLDEFNSHLRSLKSLGRPTEYWGDLIIHLMASKFDSETRLRWREETPVNSIATFEDISKFIKKGATNWKGRNPRVLIRLISIQRGHRSLLNSLLIVLVKVFTQLEPIRASIIDNCPVEERCRTCNGKHHSLIHITNSPSTAQPSLLNKTNTPSKSQTSPLNKASSTHLAVSSKPTPELNSGTALTATINTSRYVFLATALVELSDANNRTVVARAMLDSGSMLNFITKSLASKLGLKTTKSPAQIRGIGGSSIMECNSSSIELRSLVDNYSASIEVHILPKISEYQPSIQYDSSKWSIPANIKLADPKFCSPQRVDLLIGAELFFELQSVGQIKLGDNLPILQNTRLGWVVSGKVNDPPVDYQICNLAVVNSPSSYLDTLMERFWAIEEGDDLAQDNISINKCENHFLQNCTRNNEGRFIIRLPFSSTESELGNSAVLARRRFFNLETKLNRDSELRDSYNAFMSEYVSLGHMELVKTIESNHFYLPHHCVFKPDSTSTKLRVVFDGSAKTSSGTSLNQILMCGPVIQNELFTILLRFRSHAYAISADITKMYRQVIIHPDDRRFQYIYWRFDPNDPLLTYQLKTVTYGTTPASFLATRCLLQLALDHESEFPTASSTIRNDMYVDDLLSGANSKEEVIAIKDKVSFILQSAGMSLRKWCSNEASILADIPDEDREQLVQINDDEFIKTLGLYWQSNSDTFRINVNLGKDSPRITKRTVISEIAKIFDPIGLISPVVVLGKMFMQQLWQLKLNWDESLPMDLHTNWSRFRENLQKLQALYIPRHIFNHCQNPTNIQIHGFADASQKGYGAAVYVRSHTSKGVIVRLLCSKSRVAPVKQTTLPRLELLAAQLLSKLVAKIKPNLNFPVDDYFFWTDSMIVLHWLNAPSARWNTFVANRVSNIQSLVATKNWRHVSSNLNPADLISRGLLPEQLIISELWWNGPRFLQSSDESWSQPFLLSNEIELFEQKKPKQLLIAMSSIQSMQLEDAEGMMLRIHARGSFLTVQNAMSYVLRFIYNTRNPANRRTGPISSVEAVNGLQAVIRLVQMTSYSSEYHGLQNPSFIIRDPKLKSLSLFMGEDKIIRVGGRLKFSSLSYTSKHPALLPPNHFFTQAVFLFIHRTHLHVGPQGLLAAVRCNYWPINGRRLARNVFKQCVSCTRARPILLQQKMSDLPSERVNQAYPFYYVGVDYCGRFYVHFTIRGRVPTKAYLAVFVCFVTKAVHLELASSLTTASFMGALKRFISTRGLPKKIVSDNGTNFVGANSELHELFELLQCSDLKSEIQLMCQRDKVEWSFAPPGSPHFGGLYEAAVKSAKYHLRRLTLNAKLTYEELSTLIKQVESVLNSRPLVPIATDDVIEVLTPGHFLVGRPLNSIPELGSLNSKLDHLTHWNLTKGIFQNFWSRWSKEYIQELQHRHLWTKESPNIKVGTIVIIKEDDIPSLKWKLGKIIDTHPGVDGRVRVVTIKTATGELKRAITKIAPLPIDLVQSKDQGGENVNDQQSIH